MPKTRRIKAKGAGYYAQRVKEKIKKDETKFKDHLQMVLNENLKYRDDHGFRHYNKVFRFALNNEILDELKKIPRGKKRPLVIVEDGAGEGVFLAKLKSELRKAGIPCETTALELTNNFELLKKFVRKEIDKLPVGPAENFVPEKPVDAIISLHGSIHFTLKDLRKDHLLKFAHSLRKGGIMLVGFSGQAGILNRKQKTELERAFQKRGFQAKFHVYPKLFPLGAPDAILILRRTNAPFIKPKQ